MYTFSNKHSLVDHVLHYKDTIDHVIACAGVTINDKILVKLAQAKLTPECLKTKIFSLVMYGMAKQKACQKDWAKYIELVQEQSIAMSHWIKPSVPMPSPWPKLRINIYLFFVFLFIYNMCIYIYISQEGPLGPGT